jgi:glycosyltransferase involved in cell wall biosynthesis
MRIGLMMRALDEHGGISVYAENLAEELLRLDRHNHYVLFYRSAEHLGRFARFENVRELHLPGRSKAIWDQIAIPRACRREKLDVVLHPKFTVPLFSPCPAVMVVHGADWFIPEQAQYYSWWDVRYVRAVMPLYFRRAVAVISVSRLVAEGFESVLELPPGKLRTVYFGPARHFRRVEDEEARRVVLERYGLPESFIFTLTKRRGDARKNLGNLLAGYAKFHASHPLPPKLVVGGKDCHLFREEYGLDAEPFGADVVFPGWIEQSDLPAVYSAARMFLYPSNVEAFPIPITEAMACGTPIVTSDVNGLQEIAGDAAMLVDPADAEAIAVAIAMVVDDSRLHESLARRGLERSRRFDWERCAQQILGILTEASATSDPSRPSASGGQRS